MAATLMCLIVCSVPTAAQQAPGESGPLIGDDVVPDVGPAGEGLRGIAESLWSLWTELLNFVIQGDERVENPLAVTLTLGGFTGVAFALFDKVNDYINAAGTTFDIDDRFPGGIPAISLGFTVLFTASGRYLPLVELFWRGTTFTFILLIGGLGLGLLTLGLGGGTAASLLGIGGSIKTARGAAGVIDLKDELKELENAGLFISDNLVQRLTRLLSLDDFRDTYTDFRRIPECTNGHLNPRGVGPTCNYCGTNTWNRRP